MGGCTNPATSHIGFNNWCLLQPQRFTGFEPPTLATHSGSLPLSHISCFEGSAEGGLKQVNRDFGGQPLCRGDGGNRALDTVVVAPLSHFLWFVVWCWWFLISLFYHFAFSTAVDNSQLQAAKNVNRKKIQYSTSLRKLLAKPSCKHPPPWHLLTTVAAPHCYLSCPSLTELTANGLG